MASIFSKIINKEIPGHIIKEDDDFIAFLDINPLVEGHCLVVPKKEIDYIFDLEDKLLADLTIFAKSVSIALKKAVPCLRIGIAVIGLEVPHAHMHLVPLNDMNDINFSQPKLHPSADDLKKTAEAIKAAL